MSLTAISQSAPLDWTQRPESLKSEIENYHIERRKFNKSHDIDCDSHGVCNLSEFNLFKAMIIDAYPAGQKEFNVLEVGSRNFEWCQKLADFIEDPKNKIPKDVKVNIFGIRNEGYLEERLIETDRCKIYRLGAFKIEELFAKFKELNFDLENKVDMAISTWEFRNMVDPVGTVAQTCNLLRKGGYLLTSGFFFLCNDEQMRSMDSDAHNKGLTQLFLDLKAPFLTKHTDHMRSLNHFILKKPDKNPCQIPMSYKNFYTVDDGYSWKIRSFIITRYKREPQVGDQEGFRLPERSGGLSGDKDMYTWLRKNNVFHCESEVWKPLQAKDDHKESPPLYQAAAEGDVGKIRNLLGDGHDIDESGTNGNNPIHIAISKIPDGGSKLAISKIPDGGSKHIEAFNVLMEKKPNLNLFNSEGRTPLHEAVLIDNPEVMQKLLNAGANVNAWAWGYPVPLSLAIKEKKDKAIEILTKNGAKISEDDEKILKERGYYNLHLKMRLPGVF